MGDLDPRAVVVVGKALEVAGDVEEARAIIRSALATLDALATLSPASGRSDFVRHDTLAAEMNVSSREAAALVRRVPGAKRVGRRWVVERAALSSFLASAPRSARPANVGSPIDRELEALGFGAPKRAGAR